MTNQRNKIEEQALDAMLLEALGKVEPPDLTSKILSRFSQGDDSGQVRAIVAATPKRTKQPPQPAASRRRFTWLASAAAIAASVMMVVWLRQDRGPAGVSLADPAKQPMIAEATDPIEPAAEVRPEQQLDQGLSPPRRGIPLVVDSTDQEPTDQEPIDPIPSPASSSPEFRRSLQAVTLVSKQFDSALTEYWSAVGIEPAAEAERDQVVARLAANLGVELPAEAINDPERLMSEFSGSDVASKIASRWMQQITERGLGRVDQQAREQLSEDLATCLQGNQPFDETVARWIDGRSSQSSAFYAAVSHGDPDAMARRLAALTMNVDLRCTRCHDAKIEGNERQQDYWSFTALLARGVARDADGQVNIDPDRSTTKSVFYELADGRQRLAEPAVANEWIGVSSEEKVDSVGLWAERLTGSEALARGAVNSLWQLVHGQPLRGRVVDPITAPHNDALDRIEDQLVQDLLSSRFNVGRTLSLIIASPATRRGVPESLLPENALVVSEAERSEAIEAVNAFAAALPRHAELSLAQRVDQAIRAIGGKLDQEGRPFVAQLGDAGAKPSGDAAGKNKPLAVDFPVRGEALPVQWLTLIDDEQDQINHLGYLAGKRQLPKSVQDAISAMQADEEVSKELLLNRVWWLVRPY
jgi:hypothetical protein